MLAADRRQAARLAAERARVASDSFRRHGADWDEMRALGLPAEAIEAALLAALPARLAGSWISAPAPAGCWRCWRRGPRRRSASMPAATCWPWPAPGWPSTASAPIARCARPTCTGCRCPMPASTWWPCRWCCTTPRTRPRRWPRPPACCGPDGLLLVVDLAAHDRAELLERHAHRWPGFDDAGMRRLARPRAGCAGAAAGRPPGPLAVRLWPARRLAAPVAAVPALTSKEAPPWLVPICSMRSATACCSATAAWAAGCRR